MLCQALIQARHSYCCDTNTVVGKAILTTVSILHRGQRLRAVMQLVQGHTAGKRQSQDLNPGSLALVSYPPV